MTKPADGTTENEGAGEAGNAGGSTSGNQNAESVEAKVKSLGFSSIDDLIADRAKWKKNHEEAAKKISEQGSELGELRQRVAALETHDGSGGSNGNGAKPLDEILETMSDEEVAEANALMEGLDEAGKKWAKANPAKFLEKIQEVSGKGQDAGGFFKKPAKNAQPSGVESVLEQIKRQKQGRRGPMMPVSRASMPPRTEPQPATVGGPQGIASPLDWSREQQATR